MQHKGNTCRYNRRSYRDNKYVGKDRGSITDDGGAEISEKGICINTTGNPTVRNQRTIDGSGSSSFTSNLILLAPDTYYYVRAYARNKAGTGYGDQKEFSTPPLTFGSAEDTEGNVYGPLPWEIRPG
jgi:hypothetical protein